MRKAQGCKGGDVRGADAGLPGAQLPSAAAAPGPAAAAGKDDTPMTVLDRAHAAMADRRRGAALRFYQLLADATLFVLLEREAEGERVDPQIFDLADGPVVLVFDSEERLAELGAGAAALCRPAGADDCAASGGHGVVAGAEPRRRAPPSETLLPPEAMRWLSEMLEAQPAESCRRSPRGSLRRRACPMPLVDALTLQAGAARRGWPVRRCWRACAMPTAGCGHVLALMDAAPGAQAALARAMAEALAFSGLEAGELDVTFLDARRSAPLRRWPRVARAVRCARTPHSPNLPPGPQRRAWTRDRPPRADGLGEESAQAGAMIGVI